MARTEEEIGGLRSGLATEIRASLYQEVQTNIQERISQVSVLVQEYESKSKDVGQMLREDHRKEMSSIESQLNTIYQEYEKMEKSLEDYRSSYSNDWIEISKATKNNEDNLADVFLQQAQRQITEKTSALETLMNFRHDELDQKTTSALINMDAKQESLSSGLDSVESQLGLVGYRVEALEKIFDEIQAKLAAEIEKRDRL